MSVIPNHRRPRREKLFGDGRPVPLDREAKVRVMWRARALMRRTEKGKHYGPITAKALAVLEALLWGFHNARSGLCFPSLESIAEKAGCARSTVCEAIKALEDAGILTWVNRIARIRERMPDLFGKWANRTRVIRTSNGYRFHDPKADARQGAVRPGVSSKSDYPSGTPIQDSIPLTAEAALAKFEPDSPLLPIFKRWSMAIGAK